MALPQGIAFRASNAFVTDVSPDFCENGVPDADTQIDLGEEDYPTTSTQGNNLGWETISGGGAVQCRNRNNSNARLSGLHTCSNATDINIFRLDLPSTGSKLIRQAAGDFNYSTGVANELFDTSSSLGTLSTGSTSAAATWKDATNVERSSAGDWATNNAAVSKTFTTTILRLQMGSGALQGTFAFFFVDTAGPTISVQPTNQTAGAGSKARFNVTASGTGTLHYQWTKDGGSVGTDSSTYLTDALGSTDNGDEVYVTVTDDGGSVESTHVTLTVGLEIRTAF